MALAPFQKPPPGMRINPKHPLSAGIVSAWMFNESGKTGQSNSNELRGHSIYRDMLDPTKVFKPANFAVNAPTTVAGRGGMALVANTFATAPTSYTAIQFPNTVAFSVMMVVQIPSGNQLNKVLIQYGNAGITSGWWITWNNPITRYPIWKIQSSGSGLTGQSTTAMEYVAAAGDWVTMVASFDGRGTVGNVFMGMKGQTAPDYHGAGAALNYTSAQFGIGFNSVGVGSGIFESAIIWRGRCLQKGEAEQLHNDPYGMFRRAA